MKAITIHQPWATLIALGEKRFETRSWATKYRGPIAIHSGKQIDNHAFDDFHSTLWQHGIFMPCDLPSGSIIAIANLTECYAVKRDVMGGLVLLESPHSRKFFDTSDTEFKFGDFTPGRFAWELANVRQIEPIPAKGQQRLWNWDGNGY